MQAEQTRTGSAAVPDTMSLEEFAKAAGISRTLAYRLASEGTLPVPVLRIGRRILVSRRAYAAWLGAPQNDLVEREAAGHAA